MSQSRRKPPKGSPKDGPTKIRPDLAETAYRVMMEATGQAPKTKPHDPKAKNPIAVRQGRKGGRAGGKARRDSLTGKRRSEIAKHAAESRWTAQDKDEGR